MFDRLPMRATIQSLSTATDAGGGVQLAYSTAQVGVKCSINTASASTRELFAQMGMVVTHRVAFLASDLTVTVQRGWQIITDDRSETYTVRGISRGRAYGPIPEFVYLDCESQL